MNSSAQSKPCADAQERSPRFSPCDLCDEAFHGLIRAKLETEERLQQMYKNHDGAMRLYSEWRSRAEKAEAALQAARNASPQGNSGRPNASSLQPPAEKEG